MTTIVKDVALALRAALGGVRIVTRDELALFAELAKLGPPDVAGKVVVYTWSPVIGAHTHDADGVHDVGTGQKNPLSAMDVDEFIVKLPDWITSKTNDPDTGRNNKPPFVLCLVGCDATLEDDPLVRRALIESCRVAKARGALVGLVGRSAVVHAEISDELPVLKHGLPARNDARPHIQGLLAEARLTPPPAMVEELLDAGQGLTLSRQLDALGIAIKRAENEHRPLSVGDVMRFKEADMAEGALTVRNPVLRLADLVGYKDLKAWLADTHKAMSPAARAAGIPAPKGVLLAGPPGTGKTALVEAAAHDWGVPWLVLDIGSVFQSYIGESERNMREALDTADRMAPCVMHVDEVDTVFSARGGGDADGGTSKRIFSTFLRWLSDKKSEVFVMMTSNMPHELDAAIIRRGRLDNTFFVDLPPAEQRLGIWMYYLKAAKIEVEGLERALEHFVTGSADFAPGEIESVVLAVRRAAFASGKPPGLVDVQVELARTVPLARSMAARVEKMRTWAREFARPAE